MSSAARRIKLRRADACTVCGRSLDVGEMAIWEPAHRYARCVGCEPIPAPSEAPTQVSEAGRLGDTLGGIVVAVSGEPQHERAWARGADGEVKLARKLERWTAGHEVILLHDRRMPAGSANIDHIAVGPSGVTVIDAKRYRGRIAVERRGGLLGPRTEHLLVHGRDRTKLVDGVLAQAEAVRAVLRASRLAAVPVAGVLCFVDGDWPLLGRLEVRGVPVLPPRHAAKLCRTDGPLDTAAIRQAADVLAKRLPPA